MQVNDSKIVEDDVDMGDKCHFELGTYSHNPLKDWLKAREKEDYPEFVINRNKVTVNWGEAENFRCDFKKFDVKLMKLKIRSKELVREDQAIEKNFRPTQFSNITNEDDVDLRCLPLKVELELTLEMLKFKGKTLVMHPTI